MNQLPKKILFVYCTAASLFITANGLLTANSVESIVFTALFIPVTLYFVYSAIKQLRNYILIPKVLQDSETRSQFKVNKTEFTIAIVLLLGLTTLGILSISNGRNETQAKPPIEQKSIIEIERQEPLTLENKDVVVIKSVAITIDDGSPFVNIRSEPTVYSEAIGQAEDGDSYELVEEETGWYKIKFGEEQGFISIKYAKVIEE